MRSSAVVAGFVAVANAYAYGYPEAYNTTSSSVAEYHASSTSAGYPVHHAESSSAPAYAVSSAYAAYPVSSKSPVYPVYTTTSVVTGLTTVCPEPTTVTYGTKTYTVSKSTTLVDNDCEYTTTYTYEAKPTPSAAKSTHAVSSANSHYAPPAYSQASSASHAVPYPSAGNGTTAYPTGVKPSATASKPATPEFTGAAAQAGVGLLAIVGAVAAFL